MFVTSARWRPNTSHPSIFVISAMWRPNISHPSIFAISLHLHLCATVDAVTLLHLLLLEYGIWEHAVIFAAYFQGPLVYEEVTNTTAAYYFDINSKSAVVSLVNSLVAGTSNFYQVTLYMYLLYVTVVLNFMKCSLLGTCWIHSVQVVSGFILYIVFS